MFNNKSLRTVVLCLHCWIRLVTSIKLLFSSKVVCGVRVTLSKNILSLHWIHKSVFFTFRVLRKSMQSLAGHVRHHLDFEVSTSKPPYKAYNHATREEMSRTNTTINLHHVSVCCAAMKRLWRPFFGNVFLERIYIFSAKVSTRIFFKQEIISTQQTTLRVVVLPALKNS